MNGITKQFIQEFFLNEKLKTSMSSLTKKSKLKRLGGSQGMKIARQKKDATYMRYQRERKKMLALRAKLRRKYASKGMMKARRMANR